MIKSIKNNILKLNMMLIHLQVLELNNLNKHNIDKIVVLKELYNIANNNQDQYKLNKKQINKFL